MTMGRQMKLQSLKYASILLALVSTITGCAFQSGTVKSIPYQQHIDDGRYKKDRTLVLSDISPVVPAYVEHPYDVCDLQLVRKMSSKGLIEADLSQTRNKRVYRIGDVKCVIPQK